MKSSTTDATGAFIRGWLCRLRREERGQEVAEMAMVMPFLLMFVLGVVEFGSLYGTTQAMTGVGREGANIAARGAPLDTVAALMMENGGDLDLARYGGAIVSEVVVVDSVPIVQQQVASAGYAGFSRVGDPSFPAPGLNRMAYAEGSSFYVVELFYVREDRTPLRALFGTTVPDTLYSRSIF